MAVNKGVNTGAAGFGAAGIMSVDLFKQTVQHTKNSPYSARYDVFKSAIRNPKFKIQ
jgi:hypothetical protein